MIQIGSQNKRRNRNQTGSKYRILSGIKLGVKTEVKTGVNLGAKTGVKTGFTTGSKGERRGSNMYLVYWVAKKNNLNRQYESHSVNSAKKIYFFLFMSN